MSCCCTKIYLGFCTVNPCANFDTGLTAQAMGTHTLKFTFLDIDYTIKKDFLLGDAIIFPLSGMNEKAEVVAQLIGPDDEVIQFEFDTVLFDCFLLKTNITYAL